MRSRTNETEDKYPSNGSDLCLRHSGDDSGCFSTLSNYETRVSQLTSNESDQVLSVNSIESRSIPYLGDVNQDNYISHLFDSNDLSGDMGCKMYQSYPSALTVGVGISVTSPNSLSSQPSHCLMRSQPILGQPHPGAYTSYVMSENEEYDPTYINFSSMVHEDSNEIDSVSPPPSEGRDAELLIVDTNIDGLQSDSWPDIEILEEKFNSNLRRRRYAIWSLLLLVIVCIIIGVSIAMTSQLTQATASIDSCSIDDVLKGCYQSMKYQVEIPSCLVGRYQALRKTFLEKLDFKMSDKNSCSSENLALLSIANSTNDIMCNTTILQRYGLSLLYFATKGRLWNNRRDWLSDISYCQWGSTHVVCSTEGFVINISLSGNNLQGSLPSNLMTFLPRLQYLNAEANSLTGHIPSDLSRLSVLVLDKNALSGAIPKPIVESDTMKVLSLSHNNEVTMDRKYTFFSGSQWTVLSLGRVEHVPLGLIPSEISKLTNLQHLDLSFSSMTGTIPSELGLLQNLTSLDISGNAIIGTIPTELGNMIILNSLILYMNDLSGTIPSEIGRLKQMNQISLDTNSLNGVIPSEICLLVNLVVLSLSNNKLSGQFPEDIGKMPNLKEFHFAPNNFNGVVPADLCELKLNGKLVILGTIYTNDCVENLGGLFCPNSMPKCCCP